MYSEVREEAKGKIILEMFIDDTTPALPRILSIPIAVDLEKV